MHLLLLPGNSVHNKPWIESLRDELAPLFNDTCIQYYHHWETGVGDIDWRHELHCLARLQKPELVLCAKSAGVGVALAAISKGVIVPRACIFIGTPLDWSEKHGNALSPLLEHYSIPTLFIQNTRDPYASSTEVKAFLARHSLSSYALIELKGATHDYPDLSRLKEFILQFLHTLDSSQSFLE